MASSYSTNLKIELQATGENSGTWGTITNTNLGTALEQAVVGYGNPSYASDANLTLTYTDTNAAQAARALVLNVTSAVSLTATRELIVPTIQKQYIVQNNTTGSQSITVKTSGGTGITVTSGRKAHLYVNGTDVIFMDDFVDINGGTIDGTTIGASSAAAGTFTTLGATTGNITTVNATTVDTTNVEVTNIKAKDGTAAGSIADSTGVVTLASSVLTTTDINGGTIDGTTIGGSSAAAGTFTTLTASSIATFAAGSAAAPSITTTGDTNTGLFFPAADTIAFTEGGVEAMRIENNGRVGIGTSSPVAKLQVAGSSASFIFNDSGTQIYNNNVGQVKIYTSNAAGFLSLGSGGREEDLLIAASTGNVGIGTTSPDVKLRVDAASPTRGIVETVRGTGSTGSQIAFSQDAVADWAIGQPAGANAFAFFSGRSPSADGTERMRLDSSGNLGIGNTSPATTLSVGSSAGSGSNGLGIYLARGATTNFLETFDGTKTFIGGTDSSNGFVKVGSLSNHPVSIVQANAAAIYIDTSKNVGIQTAGSTYTLGSAFQLGRVFSFAQDVNSGYLGAGWFGTNSGTATYAVTGNYAVRQSFDSSAGAIKFFTAPTGTAGDTVSFTQAMTLDASGNLGIGTTSPSTFGKVAVQVAGTTTPTNAANVGPSSINLYPATNSASTDCTTGIFGWNSTGPGIGSGIGFSRENSGDWGSQIRFYTHPTTTTNIGDITERARITSGGDLLVGQTTNALADTGHILDNDGIAYHITNGITCLTVNRKTSDGTLVDFLQDGVSEGTISVSGTTVSYNGGHLSRYSQTTDDTRIPLVKGTVMSNLDQMAVWEKDGEPLPNEQLNCMKVSDVEGDVNVAGVFVNWDNDDDVYTNDMNVAMTGDMIIRIAQGVTVQRGDLLMSAGDGTAKPQGDDIIRSKTVAKVTSNHVTCTYEDGSYCVPCVLMAC